MESHHATALVGAVAGGFTTISAVVSVTLAPGSEAVLLSLAPLLALFYAVHHDRDDELEDDDVDETSAAAGELVNDEGTAYEVPGAEPTATDGGVALEAVAKYQCSTCRKPYLDARDANACCNTGGTA